MAARRKRALGRGMADLVEGSFSSIVDPATARMRSVPPRPMEARAASPEPATAPAPAERALPHETPRPQSQPQSSAQPGPPRLPVAEPLVEVVCVASGKGGTGKSVLAGNLGVALAATSRVTILDADLALANIHILFNLTPRYNAAHLISRQRTMDEILLKGPRDVGVIPGGSGVPELASLTEPMLRALMSGIATLESSVDTLIIDMPGGLDRQSLFFLLAADRVLVVTTDDITAMTDAYAVIKTIFSQRPQACLALIVNRARSQESGLETYQKVAHVTRKFLGRELALAGIVPYDEMVERSVAERVPVVIGHPECPSARAITMIGARLEVSPSSVSGRQAFSARFNALVAAR